MRNECVWKCRADGFARIAWAAMSGGSTGKPARTQRANLLRQETYPSFPFAFRLHKQSGRSEPENLTVNYSRDRPAAQWNFSNPSSRQTAPILSGRRALPQATSPKPIDSERKSLLWVAHRSTYLPERQDRKHILYCGVSSSAASPFTSLITICRASTSSSPSACSRIRLREITSRTVPS